MTTPSLPSLFYPDASSYSMDEPGGVMRTEVAGGFARYALDWDRGTQRYGVTFLFELDRFSIWNVFYMKIVKKGAISFYMPLDSGFGVSQHLVNILPGSYSVTRDGILNIVTFTVEAENQANHLSDAEALSMMALYEIYNFNSDDLLARISQFANSDAMVL